MKTMIKDVGSQTGKDTSASSPAGRGEVSKDAARSTGDTSLEIPPEGFDEIAYLAAFPDVARSIKLGQLRSALDHYRVHGQREDRLTDLRYQRALLRGNIGSFPPANIDVVFGCKSGMCLIHGWIKDDEWSPIKQIVLLNTRGLWATTQTLFRCRRKDVTDTLSLPDDRAYGFWTVLRVEQAEAMCEELEVIVSTAHERKTFNCQLRPVTDGRFREMALEQLARVPRSGDGCVEPFLHLDNGLGRLLIDFNLDISKQIAQSGHTIQVNATQGSPEGSIVVCLFGKPEFLTLQAALFSKCQGIENYEFIYVSNSPEIAERLIKDARIASRIYGLSITLIILPGNAGFGAANNVGLNAARSRRILFVNPDVFPLEPNWPLQHTQIVQNSPRDQVAIFGVPLFYDDGSLMHGGMYFEIDSGLSLRDNVLTQRDMIRVEHYGKGAPPATQSHLAVRPVPAVTGAFISVDRSWFESLDGFSLEYIFGHYEDADLCLKSLSAGMPAWMQYLPFLHLEGKGSIPHPAQQGASIVNRWHFTQTWSELVKTGLCGKTPRHSAMRGQQ